MSPGLKGRQIQLYYNIFALAAACATKRFAIA